MCGIFCVYNPTKQINVSMLHNCTKSLSHRGPDGIGTWINEKENVGIGHTRLSIVDLSHKADQPFQTERFIISFNGEIYNFRSLKKNLEEKGYSFRTTSDTEVLVTAWEEWGVDCLNNLNGCYAFVLYEFFQQVLQPQLSP